MGRPVSTQLRGMATATGIGQPVAILNTSSGSPSYATSQASSSAAGIGGAAALTMQLVRRLIVRPEAVSTAGVLAILMTSGLADYLEAWDENREI